MVEICYGVGKNNFGLVVLFIFGIGIGFVVIYNGMLIFNIEFGYFEVGGKEVEERVVFLVKEKNDWIYLKWVK